MTIKESENLTYQKFPFAPDGSGTYSAPSKSILDRFEHLDSILVLHFRNGFSAKIQAKNLDGERELALVAQKLEKFIGRSYEEILDFNFNGNRGQQPNNKPH